jgi:hypothetical protein
MGTLIAEADEATASGFADPIQEARKLLAKHYHFRGRVHTFEFMEYDQVLLVRGQVPSFYLKQVLQSVLRDVAGIKRIENQVDVVCSDGLSSVGRR